MYGMDCDHNYQLIHQVIASYIAIDSCRFQNIAILTANKL